MFRTTRRFAVIASAVAAIAMTAMPASAQGVGAGVISGTVNLSPGFATPPAPLANQTFTFSGVTLAGVSAGLGCVGLVAASAQASGGSIAENVAGGVGTLSATATGTCSVSGGVTLASSGVYVRAGVLVVVAMTGTFDGATAAVVVPVSLFLPNQTPPATTTSATFVGAWAVAAA
jgi:hypothetical protein